jgi:hypothetical protein
MPKHFYNTCSLTGENLVEANEKAKSQEQKILNLFLAGDGNGYTPSDVLVKTPGLNGAPITSVRRAMANLTKDLHLVKTDEMRDGIYGKPEHIWKLNRRT